MLLSLAFITYIQKSLETYLPDSQQTFCRMVHPTKHFEFNNFPENLGWELRKTAIVRALDLKRCGTQTNISLAMPTTDITSRTQHSSWVRQHQMIWVGWRHVTKHHSGYMHFSMTDSMTRFTFANLKNHWAQMQLYHSNGLNVTLRFQRQLGSMKINFGTSAVSQKQRSGSSALSILQTDTSYSYWCLHQRLKKYSQSSLRTMEAC